MKYIAKRLEQFPEAPDGRRRYPWHEWADGHVWEIRHGEDYDVRTENMRVNLHMRADALSRRVRTRKTVDDHGEGLVFQFFDPEETVAETAGDTSSAARDTRQEGEMLMSAAKLLDQLYIDAVELYERARREVTIPRRDGGTQKYAPTRYKQQIDRGKADGGLVAAIAKIVRRPTVGYGHLEAADRPDLMVETLVTDTTRPYHHLLSPETVRIARKRLDEYRAGRDAR